MYQTDEDIRFRTSFHDLKYSKPDLSSATYTHINHDNYTLDPIHRSDIDRIPNNRYLQDRYSSHYTSNLPRTRQDWTDYKREDTRLSRIDRDLDFVTSRSYSPYLRTTNRYENAETLSPYRSPIYSNNDNYQFRSTSPSLSRTIHYDTPKEDFSTLKHYTPTIYTSNLDLKASNPLILDGKAYKFSSASRPYSSNLTQSLPRRTELEHNQLKDTTKGHAWSQQSEILQSHSLKQDMARLDSIIADINKRKADILNMSPSTNNRIFTKATLINEDIHTHLKPTQSNKFEESIIHAGEGHKRSTSNHHLDDQKYEDCHDIEEKHLEKETITHRKKEEKIEHKIQDKKTNFHHLHTHQKAKPDMKSLMKIGAIILALILLFIFIYLVAF